MGEEDGWGRGVTPVSFPGISLGPEVLFGCLQATKVLGSRARQSPGKLQTKPLQRVVSETSKRL